MTLLSVVLGAVLAGGTEREMRGEFEALGGVERGLAVLLNVLELVEDVFSRCRSAASAGLGRAAE